MHCREARASVYLLLCHHRNVRRLDAAELLGFFEKGHIQTSLYSEFEQILNEGSQVRPLSEVVRGAPWRRQIALTFDGGSGADALPELLAALRGASVKCTFFLTGEWVQRYPNSAKQIVTDGHEIGNHTWSHPDLTTLSDRDISWEIERADAAIQAFYGQSTRPLFRAPFGARNNRVLRVVHALGYRSVYWSLDSLDSVGVGQKLVLYCRHGNIPARQNTRWGDRFAPCR